MKNNSGISKNPISLIFCGNAENPFALIEKPHHLPSIPLHNLDEDTALTQTLALFPQLKNVKGKNPLDFGIIHRLDTQTHGLLLVALNQKTYNDFILQQEHCQIKKTYAALCNKTSTVPIGFPQKRELQNIPDEITSFFRPFGVGQKRVCPISEIAEKNKKKITKKTYTTTICKMKYLESDTYFFLSTIEKGFRHQVRTHLAWCGYPILGDWLYNENKSCVPLQLHAIALDFRHPITKLPIHCEIPFDVESVLPQQ